MNLKEDLLNRPRWQIIAVLLAWHVIATISVGIVYGDYGLAFLVSGVGLSAGILFGYTAIKTGNGSVLSYAWAMLDLRWPTRRQAALVVVVVLAGVVSRLTLGTLGNLLAPAAEVAQHSIYSGGGGPSEWAVVALVLSAVVIGPIMEELLFRNGIQKLLAMYVPAVAAIVATSAIFTAMHVPAYGGFDSGLAALAVPLGVVFVDSCLYGWVYHRTENVVVAMACHGGANALAIATFLV